MWQNLIHWLETHRLPCPFYQTFHIKCPGCGFQSAFISLMKGDLCDSIQIYPALLPILGLFINLSLHIIRRSKWTIRINRILIILSILGILINYISPLI